MNPNLQAHLNSHTTTTCHLWAIIRSDGVRLGFTDHDVDLVFQGDLYRADSGLGASAFQRSSGLAVDNSEARGILTSDTISEADLNAGRFDGARVQVWRVNWADLSAAQMIFHGSLGQVTRRGLDFGAELRGLTEPLNQPLGRCYSRDCQAVLGEQSCGFDTTQPGYFALCPVMEIAEGGRRLRVEIGTDYAPGWFTGGKLTLLDGAGAGLTGMMRSDRMSKGQRWIELWQSFGAEIQPRDQIRLIAGCDRRAETCRLKFGNLSNFQGFPLMPTEDWLTSWPGNGAPMGGGSLLGAAL